MEQHKISFWTAILMNINIMIGVGIFFGPPMMASKAGFASFLAWPLVALLFLPVVLSIATIARIFPGAGSFYSYSKNIINTTAGFISGWSFYLGYIGVTALMTICLQDLVLETLKTNFGISLNPILFNIIFLVFISILSLVNIRLVGKIQNIGTFFKLFPLLFVLAIFAFYWNPSFSITTEGLSNIPSIMPIALFGYWGFECCCAVSHLIEGDKNNASKAILTAFFITVIIYSLFHFGLLHIMGSENLVANGTENVVNFLHIGAPSIKALMMFIIKLSMIFAFANAIFSIFTANSATLRTMATENLFPFSKQISLLNKNQRPWVAILIQGVLAIAITCITSNKSMLLSMTNMGVLTAFLMTLISLFLIQKRAKEFKIMSMALTILAFISWGLLAYYSWIKIGDSHLERILVTLPLIVAFFVGFTMFKLLKK